MNELINKISSYNLFNYLLPGVIFTVFIEYSTPYKILQESMIINAFLVYFIGLVISRIGSLIVEYPLKKIVSHEKYENFIEASKKDKKIEVLSEVNNMYRTFISLFLILIIFKLCDNFCLWLKDYMSYILIVLLFFLFVVSYIKQTKYIKKRIQYQFQKDKK